MARLPFPLVLILGFAALVGFGLLYTFLDPAVEPALEMIQSNTDTEAADSGHEWLQRMWWMLPVIALTLVGLAVWVGAASRGGLR